jgi:branched-subunit amino acid aminotransferase/4-amino-4-deoxychorismate lyase
MTGLFETMLAVGGRVVQRDEHFARLARSARELGLGTPDEEEFRAAIDRAVRSEEEIAVRCIYENARFTATARPIPPLTLRRRQGAHVVTLERGVVRERPSHKLTSYITSRPAIPNGADEALFVDGRGHILEGTTTNVFAIAGETLITARDGILPGIVRAWVIEHTPNVIERCPTIAELHAGSFLTSSLTPLAPIVTVEGVGCEPPGNEFARLRQMYQTQRKNEPP